MLWHRAVLRNNAIWDHKRKHQNDKHNVENYSSDNKTSWIFANKIYLNFVITRSKALRPSSSFSISGPKLMRQ
jgi:hypothetical protein